MPSFEAGKYAFYIWTAYGLSAAVVLWCVADSLVRARLWRRRAEAKKERRS